MDPDYTIAYLEELARKYKTGTISPAEKAGFDQWYSSYRDEEFVHSGAGDPEGVKQRMLENIRAEIAGTTIVAMQRRMKWPRIIAAASIILALGVSIFYLTRQTIITKPRQITYKNDIAPGGNKAFLTLASGQKIDLSDAKSGELAKTAGIRITKDSKGRLTYHLARATDTKIAETEYNITSTPAGGQWQVELADGTNVYLNASSSLRYPAAFSGKERKVELKGEAYFEVAKDKSHPFIVQTEKQSIEVLGTHFNVNAYADEPDTKTTLLEGSVKIQAGTQEKMLVPGQQALLKDNNLAISDADTEAAVAWKNGDFIFRDDNLQTTMRKIARWYNVGIIYDENAPSDLVPGGYISRSKNISAVLKIMESTGKVHFKVEGRRVTVTK